MPSSASIAKILLKYKQHEELSEEEISDLKRWLRESPQHEKLFDDLSDAAGWDRALGKWAGEPEATWDKIQKRVEALSPGTFENKKDTPWIRYLAVAAAITLIVIFWQYNRKPNVTPNGITHIAQTREILPSAGSATLTLGDGSVIRLDSAKSGTLAQQGNTNIVKSDSDALNYQAAKENSQNLEYNTLSTPKGTQYRLVLPDGTKVWLNAATTLRFPASFGGG